MIAGFAGGMVIIRNFEPTASEKIASYGALLFCAAMILFSLSCDFSTWPPAQPAWLHEVGYESVRAKPCCFKMIECGMELDDYYTGDNRLYCSGTQVLTSSGQVINSCGAFENFTSDD